MGQKTTAKQSFGLLSWPLGCFDKRCSVWPPMTFFSSISLWAEVKIQTWHKLGYYQVTYILCCARIYYFCELDCILQNKELLKPQLYLNWKTTQNLMEISVINLSVCQLQNVSFVHQEEEQIERRSGGKETFLMQDYPCFLTLPPSASLIKSKKNPVQTHDPLRQLTPISLLFTACNSLDIVGPWAVTNVNMLLA